MLKNIGSVISYKISFQSTGNFQVESIKFVKKTSNCFCNDKKAIIINILIFMIESAFQN